MPNSVQSADPHEIVKSEIEESLKAKIAEVSALLRDLDPAREGRRIGRLQARNEALCDIIRRIRSVSELDHNLSGARADLVQMGRNAAKVKEVAASAAHGSLVHAVALGRYEGLLGGVRLLDTSVAAAFATAPSATSD